MRHFDCDSPEMCNGRNRRSRIFELTGARAGPLLRASASTLLSNERTILMRTMIAAAAVTLLASTSLVAPALAGPPLLSRNYMVPQPLLCQAIQPIPHNGKKLQFTAPSPGDVTLAIGTLTFPPSADGAADGKVKGTTANAEGSLLVST